MLRRLGKSDLLVHPIGLGLWPIAGMTSLEVSETDSRETIEAALNCGLNFFDTAYCYGVDGISERLLGEVARQHRDQMVIATKGGVHWDARLDRINDASPRRLEMELDESLRRLGLSTVDLLYLHSPDQVTSIVESAAAMARFQEAGKARWIGVSNVNLSQLQQFHSVCPVTAVQLKYNMLQRDIEQDIVPWCLEQEVSIVAYWPLMKGLLAGKLRRGHRFDPADKRLTYPMFLGRQWEWNQQLLDRLDGIATQAGVSLITLVLGWTVSQPGITAVLCGAKRPWQIQESAAAVNWTPTAEVLEEVNEAILERNSLGRTS
jgi:aryl-alcohol dehydrogenase-like predicted oxidoreductase